MFEEGNGSISANSTHYVDPAVCLLRYRYGPSPPKDLPMEGEKRTVCLGVINERQPSLTPEQNAGAV